MLDSVEISWGNQPLPGTPSEFYFTLPSDTACLEIGQVVEPLYRALTAAVRSMPQSNTTEAAEIVTFHRAVGRISHTVPGVREGWYLFGELDRQASAGSLRTTLEGLREKARALTANTYHSLCLRQLSPAAIMFGSATPALGQTDAELLARTMLTAYAQDLDPPACDSLVRNQPLEAV